MYGTCRRRGPPPPHSGGPLARQGGGVQLRVRRRYLGPDAFFFIYVSIVNKTILFNFGQILHYNQTAELLPGHLIKCSRNCKLECPLQMEQIVFRCPGCWGTSREILKMSVTPCTWGIPWMLCKMQHVLRLLQKTAATFELSFKGCP